MKLQIKKMIALGIVGAMLTSTGLNCVTAAETSDSKFSFELRAGGAILTKERPKTDATGTYVKYNSGPSRGVNFIVYGVKKDGKLVNDTKGTAIIYPGTQRRIKQYVYENGRRKARLGGAMTSQYGTAKGVWSPDSVGNDPYAN